MFKKKYFILFVVIFVVSVVFFACAQNATLNNPNEIIDFLLNIHSPRNFTSGHISDEKIHQILLAGHQTGSARNAQPWHFTVVRNHNLINEIMRREIAQDNVLIIVSGAREPSIVYFDCALATQSMFLAAQALGLGARMFMVPLPNLNENLLYRLEAPEGHVAHMILLIGYLDDAITTASPRHPLDTRVNFIE